MNKIPFVVFLLLSILLSSAFLGCEQKTEECVFIPDTEKSTIDFRFEQLEDSLPAIQTKDQLVAFFSNYPIIRDILFGRRNYPNDSVFINTVYQRVTHPGFDTLLQETKRIFGDLSSLREQFQQAFVDLNYYYPGFKPPIVRTVITGLENDLIVTDTLIIVGLDYYLGKEGKYRPRLYDYLLTRYDPEDIVPSCMLIYGIDARFNKTNLEDRTVLADMIAYGKSFYFAKHMLPCTPDSTFLWYSDLEIQGAYANQDLIWARFVEDEVLYSANHLVKQRFLGERPHTLEVGVECPGRIAQWVGWQIVKKYMETHPETTLPNLMEMDNADRLFRDSGYRPERK